ncbi:DUF6531 domain-containing protein [Myxococcus stipitatus]|uniref:RHS repeat-associated core domain-containing protein n=1 Tax=Myxococcus stipitatus TaxID=83455 RepID=UPI001F1C68F7|nr:RHS repeat-associated core domain-containing protein [Myxococcus stipitatus]MCE9670030.1 DUF6531 domain-containing protein [Myxococcus stipitatus]
MSPGSRGLWLRCALSLLVLAMGAGCRSRTEPQDAAPKAPAPAQASTRVRLTEAELEPACFGVVPESVNSTWRVGGLEVQAGDTRNAGFVGSNGLDALVVLQNGDGQGAGEVTSASASLNGVLVGTVSAGTPLAVFKAKTGWANRLDVSAQPGGGSVRASVTTLGSLPCGMADTGYLSAGQPSSVISFEPKGLGTLAILLVEMLGSAPDARVLLNGSDILANVPVGERRLYARVVTLAATNQLETTAAGGADTSVRVAVFDADTTPTPLTVTEPEHGAYFTEADIIVAGHYGKDGRSLTINGKPAALVGNDRFRTDFSLQSGVNSITMEMTDTCANISRVCRAAILDREAPVITIRGVADGDVTQGPVSLLWDVVGPYTVTVVGTLDGVEIANDTTLDTEGEHDLLVTAEDRDGRIAMKRVRFTLLKRAPLITVTGVYDGQHAPGPVTPSVRVDSPYLEAVVITLDDVGFPNDTAVTSEGPHRLFVVAKDRAANYAFATVNFTIDRTFPVVAISGVEEGAQRATPVVLTWTATDTHLAPGGVHATLDGATFTHGDSVSAEGPHTLEVVAEDLAGNRTTARRSFTLDTIPPQLTVQGLPETSPVARDVTPTFTATDPNLKSLSATLNGNPFASGTTVTANGSYLLIVRAEDLAGNVTSAPHSFSIDRLPPDIQVAGVWHGHHYPTPVTVNYMALDAHPGTVSAKLDGVDFASGSEVSTEGPHTLVVTATDSIGNTAVPRTVAFVLDFTAPALTLTGIPTAQLVNVPVTAGWTLTEANLQRVEARLNGGEFQAGTTLSTSGDYTLVVSAWDKADNTDSKSATFTIDLVKPVITVTGVHDGERRSTPATLSWTVEDEHPGTDSATLDGAGFTRGGVVSAPGPHLLVVTATDAAGNVREERRSFTIDQGLPTVTIHEPIDGLVTREAQVEVEVEVVDGSPVDHVEVGGLRFTQGADGWWRRMVPLVSGTNVLVVDVIDTAGNTTTKRVTVVRDSDAPALTVTGPSEGARIGALTVNVRGTVLDATTVTLTVNGTAATVGADGSFVVALPLVQGDNTLVVRAVDAARNESSQTLHLRANATPPSLTLTAPTEGFVTEDTSVLVRGTASAEDGAVTVVVAGALATVASDGSFQRRVPLAPGEQHLAVVAMDGYGLRAESSVRVTRNVVLPDGGLADAGSPQDGGTSADAGGTPDAGGPPADAGTTDAGTVPPPPALLVDFPAPGAVLNGPAVGVSGQVQGGALPLKVQVNGVNASVTVRSFSMALALPEGDHTLAIVVTDAEGRTASTSREVAVDRTAPHLSVTRPATSPLTVSESPYRVQGEVGDLHLAGVTVAGQPALVVGGAFSASVALSQGETPIEVVATDAAGNRKTETVRLRIDNAPPKVRVLLPVDDTESPTPLVRVRAQVEAYAALDEVLIGTGEAEEVSPGVYEATVAVPLGVSTVHVRATDARGLVGTASVVVRYRSPETEALAVTGVQPAAGATEVKPDSLISVAFNKEATLESVREGFTVWHDGQPLAGGHSLAPGGQTATFVARSPLPEGAVLQVRVKDVDAKVGPGQAAPFVSELTVRRPPTRVRGYVMDAAFQPSAGVRVVLEGTDVTARTSADGNWSFITQVSGPRVVRFEGGTTRDGGPLPTVRRLMTLQPEAETFDTPLVLTPVDTASARRVLTTQALHVDFGPAQDELVIDGPAESLLFEDGGVEGTLTATRLDGVALPLKLESNATPTAMWQVGPAGVRVQHPVLLRFPNVTTLGAGRYVVVLAHEPRNHLVARVGLARVTSDGTAVETEEPLDLRSLELIGYMALTEEQDAIVRQAIGVPSTSGDGGTQEGALPPLPPRAPLWKRALDALVYGEAHAQSMLGLFPQLDAFIQEMVPAVVSGALRAPQERQLAVEPTAELTAFIAVPQQVTFPYAMPVSFVARREATGTAPERIDAFLAAKTGAGMDILPPAGESWSASTQGTSEPEVQLAGHVDLTRGTTVITLGARMGTELRTQSITVQAVPVGDAGAGAYRLVFTRDEQSTTGGVPLQSVVRFPNMRVTVTGPGPTMSGTTSDKGEYGIPVSVAGGESMGIACADVPLGPRPILGKDPDTGAAVVHSMVMASYPTCSPTFWVSSGRQTRADILVDARLLHGALHFVDREGHSLRQECASPDAGSTLDPDSGTYSTISNADITRTEVHFFRADDLEHPIAQFTVGIPYEECEPSQPGQRIPQGHYARVRVGPTTPYKRAIRERCRELNPSIDDDPSAAPPPSLEDEDRAYYERECRDNRENFLRLTAGDPLVVVAVNHATGHTGMTRVQVPPIVKWRPGPDGRCAEDDELGPLKVEEFGQVASISRCSLEELGIDVPVYLYPPEIDVRVWRSAEADGVRQDAPPTLIRHGGAATTRDTYVHVDTHWRVRTMAPVEWRTEDGGVRETPADLGLPPEWFDGGVAACRSGDAGTPCVPGMLRDEGVSGRLLETCSEYGEGAAGSATKSLACLRAGDLEDVPSGVPPLAGRVVRVTGSAAEEPAVAQFGVVPGRGSAALQAAMRVVTPGGQRVTLGNLPRANYYLHIVGHEVFPRDEDGDGVLTPEERNSRPPDFSEPTEDHPAGLPTWAVGMKNVYSSLDPDGFRVLRYDRDREHEFRVLELTDPKVRARGALDSRELEGDSAEADPDDLAYEFLAELLEPVDEGRATTPVGDYVVRFGGDAYGVECDIRVEDDALTGTCDSEFIDDVLSANDLLYLELYLSGNADNVLYRFNLMGVSTRVDLLKAGSEFSARRSVETGSDGASVKDRSVSIPATARFALDPGVIQRGRVKVCTSEACEAGTLVKQADVSLLANGTYGVTQSPDGLAEDPLEQLSQTGLNASRLFSLPLPASLVPMPGSGAESRRIFLIQEIEEPEPRRLVQTLGRPKGVFESANARAPGQLTVQGINVADGHLSFEHEDFAVPQLAEVVRFARTYNNQSSLVSPTGVGWTHNYDGFVQEERLGRYTVVIAGQAYDFPSCATVDEDARTAEGCATDRSHGMRLNVKSREGQVLAVVETASGVVYEFKTRARGYASDERRRWLLDRFHDGHGRANGEGWTHLTYKPDSNLVDTVERTPGRLQLKLTYVPVDLEDEEVAYRLRNLARNQGFELLDGVELRLKTDGTVLHALDFTHDKRGNLSSVARTSALPATQVWEYEYAPLPTQLSGHKLWRASNEVTKARLKLSPPTGGTPVVQWQVAYGRTATSAAYAHVTPAEVVTSVVGTGMPAPGWIIAALDATTRVITRPDGVQVTLDLNEYGNTSATQVPGLGTSTVAWGSDVRGGPVQADATTSPMGRKVTRAINDRLQVDGVTLAEAPSDALPVPGATTTQPLWAVTSRHAGTGRPVGLEVATGHGTATVQQPRTDAGDSQGVTVTDPLKGVVFTAQQFPSLDGVVQGGVDAAGNTLTFEGHETQPLGLPRSVTVSRSLTGTGGLATYTVVYGYDALGNRTSERNQTTGAEVVHTYDAVGRLLSTTVSGSPDTTTTYSYVLGEDALTVTESLSLGRWGRTQTRVTELREGLLRAERYTYGQGVEAELRYDSYQGTRLQSYVDARGKRHTLAYDTAGRMTGETVEGAPVFSHVLDDDGRVKETTDDLGLRTRVRHDVLGRAVRWEYESKRTGDECPGACQYEDVETVVLDASGAVTKRTFGTLTKKHVLESTVDALGRELSVKSGSGSHGGIEAQTFYDGAGRVTRRTDDELGLDETYAYDDVLGRMTRQVRVVQSVNGARTLTETRAYSDSPGGETTVTVTRSLSGRASEPEEIREETRTYTVDTQGRVLGLTETVDGQLAQHAWEYDALGRVALYRDPAGRTTTREYDASGNLVEVVAPGSVSTRFTHDAEGNVLTQVGPGDGESWSMTYDLLGRLESRTLASTTHTAVAHWGYDYLGGGLVEETLPDDTVVRRTYNARGQVETEVRTGTGGQRTVHTRYDGAWVKRQAAVEGASTTVVDRSAATAIDDRGRTRNEVESWAAGSGLEYQYTTQTGWNGRQSTTSETWSMRGQSMGSRTVTVQVDALGNVVRRAQGGAEDSWDYYADGQALRMVPHGYDADEAATAWEYESSGRLKVQRFGEEETEYTYLLDGLLHTVTTPDQRVRTLTYNARGLLDTETFGRDSDVRRTRYAAHDGAGRAREVWHAAGTSAETVWRYQYGPRGELVQVTQPGNDVFTYTYDGLSRVRTITPPAGSVMATVQYTYDFLGREATRRRGNAVWTTAWTNGSPEVLNELGERVERVLDGRGRVAREVFKAGPPSPDASGVARVFKDLEAVDYAYNGLDQLRTATEHRGAAQLVRSQTYDTRSRLKTVSGGGQTVTYDYHDSNALLSIQSPAGTVNYDVDALQRLSQVTLADGTSLDVQWETGGGRVSMIGNSALKHTYCHDARGRLASVTHDAAQESCTTPMGAPRLRYRYTYDERDNRLSEVVDRNESGLPAAQETTQYGYDTAERLTGVRYASGTSVLYKLAPDGARREEKALTGYAGGLGPQGFGAANALPPDHLTYGFDELGGLKEIRNGLNALVAEFTTDRAGRRVRETRGGVEQFYHFDAAGRLVEAEKKAGTVIDQVSYQYDHAGLRRARTKVGTTPETTRYLWSGGTLIEEQLPGVTGGTLYQRAAGVTVAAGSERILADGLGSAVARLGGSGALSVSLFDAWGAPQANTAPTAAQPSIGYTGHSWDSETRLTYAQQRWYDGATGQFLSLDPMGAQVYLRAPTELNPWLYSRGNPLRYTDPYGLFSWSDLVPSEKGIRDTAGACYVGLVDDVLLNNKQDLADFSSRYRANYQGCKFFQNAMAYYRSGNKTTAAARKSILANEYARTGIAASMGVLGALHPNASGDNLEPAMRDTYQAFHWANTTAMQVLELVPSGRPPSFPRTEFATGSVGSSRAMTATATGVSFGPPSSQLPYLMAQAARHEGEGSQTDGGATPKEPTPAAQEPNVAPGPKLSEGAIREKLAALAQDAWGRMRVAYEAGDRMAILDDGTKLRVGDGARQRGPCLSLVMDTCTGQVFYGQNTGVVPTSLKEPLASRTLKVAADNQALHPAPSNYPEGWSRKAGIPGSHSEVQASSRALEARPGAKLEDLAVYNVRTEDISLETAPEMPRCVNCTPITDGVRALTD